MDALKYLYDSADVSKNLLVKVSDLTFGIDITYIRQIIEAQAVLRVPDQPDYIKGVITLRDQVIPIMDMRRRLGFETKGYDDRTCFVIIQLGKKHLGLVVDSVVNLLDVQEADLSDYSGELDEKINAIKVNEVIIGVKSNEKSDIYFINPEKLKH
jgi:purine-binding chemotaxis protein CheW